MTKAILITASPRNATTGAVVTVRMAGGGRTKPYYYASNHYRAGVTELLRLAARIEWNEEGWTGGVVPSTGTLAWAPSSKADLAAFAAYYWRNAAIVVDEVDEDTGVITNRLTGKVADAVPRDDKLFITVADLSAGLDRPVVTARFAGTGGIEGGAEAAGRIRRRTWGRAFNIEGRVFDKVNNIYEFGDNAFPWQSFDAVRDGGRDAAPAPAVVAWQGSIAATLTALIAAVPVQGSGVVAPSICKAKWWTQPRGPLTADVRGEIGTGYVETVPEIAARVLAAVGGPSITNAATAAGWRAGVAGIHIDEGENINVALTRLSMGVSLLWIFDAAAGTISFREFTFSSPVVSLVSDAVSREQTFPPMKTRRIGYQRSHRLHSDGDIVATLLQEDPTAGTKLGGIAEGATSDLTLIPGGETAKISVTGNRIVQSLASAASWNIWAYSNKAQVGTAELSYRASATGSGTCLIGLATPANKNVTAYSSISFGLWFNGSTLNYVEGAAFASLGVTATVNDVLMVTYDGANIRYHKNDSVLRTVPVASGLTFHPKAMFDVGTASVFDLAFGSLTDRSWTGIVGTLKPEDGADVTANVNPGHVLPANPTVHYDVALAAKAGELPRNLFVRRYRGATEVTQDNDTAWSITASGCTATINNTNGSGIKGKIIITAVAATGWIEVTSTKAGITPQKDRIDVTKLVDSPSVGGGAGATGFDASVTAAVASTNSAAPTVILSGATMRSSAGGQIVFRGEFYYDAQGVSTTVAVLAKWQKSLTGAGSWSDVSFGYSTGGTSVTDSDGAARTEACSVAGTATGLTASTDYDLRLVAYRTGTSATTPWNEAFITGRQA